MATYFDRGNLDFPNSGSDRFNISPNLFQPSAQIEDFVDFAIANIRQTLALPDIQADLLRLEFPEISEGTRLALFRGIIAALDEVGLIRLPGETAYSCNLNYADLPVLSLPEPINITLENGEIDYERTMPQKKISAFIKAALELVWQNAKASFAAQFQYDISDCQVAVSALYGGENNRAAAEIEKKEIQLLISQKTEVPAYLVVKVRFVPTDSFSGFGDDGFSGSF